MSAPAQARPGHLPTLLASFLHFDVSFMLWVLLGALGIFIAEAASLSASEKGLMVAIPILSGSLLRVPLGLLGDRYGGRRVGIGMLLFLFIPLMLGWQVGTSLPALLGIGLMLGTAGASFAVALPLASRWYPAERQGVVMGIAAAGNSGTVVANILAPKLAGMFGWHNVLGLAMLPLALTLLAFMAMARDSPDRPLGLPARRYLAALGHTDLWWFCFLYSVTFGGYVGLSSFLPLFFHDQYRLSAVEAGRLTALAALVGSASRPVGGYLADRFGGTRILAFLLAAIAAFYGLVSLSPALGVMAALVTIGMLMLGMGNGAVFQLVPQRFGHEIGMATGIVGAIGGLGGFMLPVLLGTIKQSTGSFAVGFLLLATLAVAAAITLRILVPLRGWLRSTTVAVSDA